MAKKTINLTGTSGATYNLDNIQADNRMNGSLELRVQVHKYIKGQQPNPANLETGQMWLSQLVADNEGE